MRRAGMDPAGVNDIKQSGEQRARFWEQKRGAPTPATKYMREVSFEFGDLWQLELEQADASIERTPEERLALEVIAQTLEDFKRYWSERSGHGRRLFEQAESFMFLEPDPDRPYGFDYLCVALRMNPDEIRRRLRLWLANQRLQAIKQKDRARGISASASAADIGLDTAGVAA